MNPFVFFYSLSIVLKELEVISAQADTPTIGHAATRAHGLLAPIVKRLSDPEIVKTPHASPLQGCETILQRHLERYEKILQTPEVQASTWRKQGLEARLYACAGLLLDIELEKLDVLPEPLLEEVK